MRERAFMPVNARISGSVKVTTANNKPSTISKAEWVYPRAALYKKDAAATITMTGCDRHLALERRWWFWVAPVFGDGPYQSTERATPAECHVLLCTDKQRKEHVLFLPIFAGDWRAAITGDAKGMRCFVHGGVRGSAKPNDKPIMLVTKGKDPIALMRDSMALLSQELKTFRLREDKRLPAFVDLFGWCTWNAYYQEVSQQKVLSGLAAFKKSGVKPRFMILDDGWQDINKDGQMNSFGTNKRFAKGLSPLVEKAKQQYGIEIFGVWHALQGYWGGVNPKGSLAKQYAVIAKPGLKPCNMKKQQIGLVSKADIARFYQDFHASLRLAGVDMVKIDSQSGMQELCAGTVGYGETMAAYQQAIQGSTQTHFEGNLLHCMSNTQDVAYHMSASSGWRNSDDFYPNQKPSHANHMVVNAFNAVWSHTFSCPDWDMFMSGHYTGAYHAAARAISGGPVYISDKPGDHDAKLIKRLCLSDGRALRSKHSALPLVRRLYDNPADGECLLLLRNHNDRIGVIGAFHCCFEGEPITDSFTVKDLNFGRGEFVLWYARAAKIERIHSRDTISITLAELEAEIIHVAQLDEGGVTAIGLIDKDNASAAIRNQGWGRDNAYRVSLEDGGKLGVYCLRKPRSAIDDEGRHLSMKHDSNSGLLQITIKSSGPNRCYLYW